MNLIGTILVYAGLFTLFLGAVSILRPLKFLGIWSWFQGVMLVAAGALVFFVGVSLPAKEQRVETPATHLDEFVPAYQFGEFHSIRIRAPRDQVYAAVKQVRADEITLFRALTWIRRLGQPTRESILNAPRDQPLLDVAQQTSFLKLAEEPGREIVLGTLVAAPRGTRLKRDPTPEDFKALLNSRPSHRAQSKQLTINSRKQSKNLTQRAQRREHRVRRDPALRLLSLIFA